MTTSAFFSRAHACDPSNCCAVFVPLETTNYQMREHRLLYVKVAGPEGYLGVLDFTSIKQQVAAWRRGNSG